MKNLDKGHGSLGWKQREIGRVFIEDVRSIDRYPREGLEPSSNINSDFLPTVDEPARFFVSSVGLKELQSVSAVEARFPNSLMV